MPLLFSKSVNPITISRLVMGKKIKWPFDGRSSNWHVYVKQVPQIFYLVADAPMYVKRVPQIFYLYSKKYLHVYLEGNMHFLRCTGHFF